MLLRELLPAEQQWKVTILGTDIAESVLERARRARYFQLEVNRGLPVHYLVKYFQRQHLEWELKPEIRSMVEFKAHNLKNDLRSMGPFDLVMCRNVMIYFDTPLKKKILAGIRTVLAPDGYLMLGGAETVFNLDDQYERRGVGQATVYTNRRPEEAP
jgi:chemotaxis protein methyltransferase CheR